MKKHVILFALSVSMLTACKKEKTGRGDQDRLQGTWEAFQSIEVEYENDQEKYRDTDNLPAGETQYEIRGDSLLMYTNGVISINDRYAYTLSEGKLVLHQGVSSGKSLPLKWYSDVQFSLSREFTSTTGTVMTRVSEELFFKKVADTLSM